MTRRRPSGPRRGSVSSHERLDYRLDPVRLLSRTSGIPFTSFPFPTIGTPDPATTSNQPPCRPLESARRGYQPGDNPGRHASVRGFNSPTATSQYGTMSTRTLKQELESYNESLDRCLRSRYGMTLKVFKLVKAVTQLVGAGAGIYAMSLGAPPLASFAIIAVIISGPEAIEFLINQE